MTISGVTRRIATGDDTEAVVALYDEAVAWLAASGRSDQWGTTPFSARPDAVADWRRLTPHQWSAANSPGNRTSFSRWYFPRCPSRS